MSAPSPNHRAGPGAPRFELEPATPIEALAQLLDETRREMAGLRREVVVAVARATAAEDRASRVLQSVRDMTAAEVAREAEPGIRRIRAARAQARGIAVVDRTSGPDLPPEEDFVL